MYLTRPHNLFFFPIFAPRFLSADYVLNSCDADGLQMWGFSAFFDATIAYTSVDDFFVAFPTPYNLSRYPDASIFDKLAFGRRAEARPRSRTTKPNGG